MSVPEAGSSPARSYGCSNGDGNPYDFIVLTVQSDEKPDFLCAPCFIGLAADMLKAITEPDDPNVQAAMAEFGNPDLAPMSGRPVRAGHEAPADTADEDLIEAYDGVVLADELPDEFRS